MEMNLSTLQFTSQDLGIICKALTKIGLKYPYLLGEYGLGEFRNINIQPIVD
jgi:hypothetical protein